MNLYQCLSQWRADESDKLHWLYFQYLSKPILPSLLLYCSISSFPQGIYGTELNKAQRLVKTYFCHRERNNRRHRHRINKMSGTPVYLIFSLNLHLIWLKRKAFLVILVWGLKDKNLYFLDLLPQHKISHYIFLQSILSQCSVALSHALQLAHVLYEVPFLTPVKHLSFFTSFCIKVSFTLAITELQRNNLTSTWLWKHT